MQWNFAILKLISLICGNFSLTQRARIAVDAFVEFSALLLLRLSDKWICKRRRGLIWLIYLEDWAGTRRLGGLNLTKNRARLSLKVRLGWKGILRLSEHVCRLLAALLLTEWAENARWWLSLSLRIWLRCDWGAENWSLSLLLRLRRCKDWCGGSDGGDGRSAESVCAAEGRWECWLRLLLLGWLTENRRCSWWAAECSRAAKGWRLNLLLWLLLLWLVHSENVAWRLTESGWLAESWSPAEDAATSLTWSWSCWAKNRLILTLWLLLLLIEWWATHGEWEWRWVRLFSWFWCAEHWCWLIGRLKWICSLWWAENAAGTQHITLRCRLWLLRSTEDAAGIHEWGIGLLLRLTEDIRWICSSWTCTENIVVCAGQSFCALILLCQDWLVVDVDEKWNGVGWTILELIHLGHRIVVLHHELVRMALDVAWNFCIVKVRSSFWNSAQLTHFLRLEIWQTNFLKRPIGNEVRYTNAALEWSKAREHPLLTGDCCCHFGFYQSSKKIVV